MRLRFAADSTPALGRTRGPPREGRFGPDRRKVTGSSYTATCGGKSVSGTHGSASPPSKGPAPSPATGCLCLRCVDIADHTRQRRQTPRAMPTPTPEPASSPTRLEGIDVSHWQGTIDWAKVRAAGKKFAYIKASEHTTFVDDTYLTNCSRAKSAGLKVGAYHFARPNIGTTDAYAEADHFIGTADWTSGELRPVLDLEDTGGLTSSALQTWVKAFVQRIYDRTGVRAVIYVSPAFWSNKMGNSSGSPRTAMTSCGSPTGPPRVRRAFPPRTGVARAGPSGSTRRTAPCRGSADGSTSIATTAPTFRRCSSRKRSIHRAPGAGCHDGGRPHSSAHRADDGRVLDLERLQGPHMNHPLRALLGTLFVSLCILVAACATTDDDPGSPPRVLPRHSERCRDRECCRDRDCVCTASRRRLQPVAGRARLTTSP